MKKLIDQIKNVFAIEDLRSRIFNTLFFIAIYRLGSYVVLPGVDPTRLKQGATGVLGILDTLLGGAFSHASIFALTCSLLPQTAAANYCGAVLPEAPEGGGVRS
jgi:preprotein translocase subunit SecY